MSAIWSSRVESFINPAYRCKYRWDSFLWHVGSQWWVINGWQLAGLKQECVQIAWEVGVGWEPWGVGSRERVSRQSSSPTHQGVFGAAAERGSPWASWLPWPLGLSGSSEGCNFNLLWIALLPDLHQRCPVTLGQGHTLWGDKEAWARRKLAKAHQPSLVAVAPS